MRGYTGILVLGILFIAILSPACTTVNLVPGDVGYIKGNVSFLIESPTEIPDAVLEVAVFRIMDFGQAEVWRNVDAIPLHTGYNAVRLPAPLGKGNYRAFIYVTREHMRYPVVIRDFTV